MNNKKRNNKGFSLVELIVVVAIMAVLVGVLAPAYLKYVENSREQKDALAVSEVVGAIKVAATDEDIYEYIADNGPISFGETSNNDKITFTNHATNKLEAEIFATLGGGFDLLSQKWQDAGIAIKATASNGAVTVEVENEPQ